MRYRRQAIAGVLVAPAVGLGTGVWSEFGDLGASVLLPVGVPAIIVATLSAAYLWRPGLRAVVLLGVALGLLTFSVSYGSYLAIHYSRGGELNFEAYNSQPAMAAALFAIHAGVGTLVGLGVGAGAAAVVYATRALGRHGPAQARTT